jgi:sulfur transfer protein SufE
MTPREQTVIATFLAQETPEDHYQWLITQGKKGVQAATIGSDKLVPGCPSNTYFECTITEGRYHISGSSASYVIAGIIQVIKDIYHLQYVQSFKPTWPDQMNLKGLLTYQRWLGVQYMLNLLHPQGSGSRE